MKIDYRNPYWIKFQWDMSNHHENQYVTEFNKIQNDKFRKLFQEEEYIITCHFKILENYKSDDFCMVFGKPGKNMGLTYCKESGVVSFEFWTTGDDSEDNFYFLPFIQLNKSDVEKGVVVTIIRNGQKFIVYKNFEKVNLIKFKNNLIDDYTQTDLFFGCSNPGSEVVEHRYYTELDINYFSIILNETDIEKSKDLYESATTEIINKDYYNNILCLYNFKIINNLGFVYDESKNTNFMERVPIEFIIP